MGRGILLAGALAASTLTGCTATPVVSPSPTTISSENATLAEAIDTFAVFNAALDGYVGGTSDVEVLEPLVTPEFYEQLVAEDSEFAARETFTVGASSFSDEKLVDAAEWGGFGELALVVCVDISRTKNVDSKGDPSTETPLRLHIPNIVFFVRVDDSLLISKADIWNEDGYCS